MTYGQLRYRLSKLAPGVDRELIDGWIQDRYTEILDKLPWKRLEGESTYQIPPSYATGTIAITQGSDAIAGTGTAFTSDMEGSMVRVSSGPEYYTFTYVDATSGLLDRPYEGATDAEASYRIDRATILLPVSLRALRAVRPLRQAAPIQVITVAELNRIAPQRSEYGTPRYVAYSWDTFTDPPIQQAEFYPVPSATDGGSLSYSLDYIFDPADIDPRATSVSTLPWVKPAALICGVEVDIAVHLKDFVTAQAKEARFGNLIRDMVVNQNLQRGAQPMRLSREFETYKPGRYPRGRWREGFTG